MSAWDSYERRPGGFDPWEVRPVEPRWKPDRPLAERISRAGRFADIDPAVPGRVWTRYNWGGLVFWAAFTGGTLVAAKRRHDPPT